MGRRTRVRAGRTRRAAEHAVTRSCPRLRFQKVEPFQPQR